MSVLDIKTAEVFEPLLTPHRYLGAHGGRGSGKSHFFAEKMVDDAITTDALRAVCIREVQKDLKHSAMQLIKDKVQALEVGALFDPRVGEVCTPGGGVILFQGMQDHTAESIKSLEGMDRAWIEEGQTLSENSWRMLRPTIRKDGSQIWSSWNPRLRGDPIDKFFRRDTHEAGRVACVEVNWRDNPWFPKELEEERQDDLKNDPDSVPHVWDGAYVTILKGAYYASMLIEAEKQQRVTFTAYEPLMQVRAAWDIGGPGKKADAMTVVIHQNIGREIRVLDYIEGVGQVLGYYINEFNERGWSGAKKPLCILPHDAAQTHADNPTGIDFEAQLKLAGYQTKKVHSPPGIIMQRIATGRRLFPRIIFNNAPNARGNDATEALRAALGWFHEKWDADRQIGLGPEHDWAIHGADAFGLMCIDYQEPSLVVGPPKAAPKFGTMA